MPRTREFPVLGDDVVEEPALDTICRRLAQRMRARRNEKGRRQRQPLRVGITTALRRGGFRYTRLASAGAFRFAFDRRPARAHLGLNTVSGLTGPNTPRRSFLEHSCPLSTSALGPDGPAPAGCAPISEKATGRLRRPVPVEILCPLPGPLCSPALLQGSAPAVVEVVH